MRVAYYPALWNERGYSRLLELSNSVQYDAVLSKARTYQAGNLGDDQCDNINAPTSVAYSVVGLGISPDQQSFEMWLKVGLCSRTVGDKLYI